MGGKRREGLRVTCHPCRYSFVVDRDTLASGRGYVHCPMCMATISVTTEAVEQTIHVQGHSAADVERVTARVLADLAHPKEVTVRHNPWVSGSFYLVALLSLLALLLAVAQVVSILLFPLVVIGGLVAVAIVGALQLRNDAKLSQKGFLELMALSFRQLPFIGRKHAAGQPGGDNRAA